MEITTKIDEENPLFVNSPTYNPSDNLKNHTHSLEDMATSAVAFQKKFVKFSQLSVFSPLQENDGIYERLIRKILTRVSLGNRKLLEREVREQFPELGGSNFGVWAGYYLEHVEKDHELWKELIEFLNNFNEKRNSKDNENEYDLLNKKHIPKENGVFLKDFSIDNTENIVRMLEFFLESSIIYREFFQQTMRKIPIKIYEIPIDFIKKVIHAERTDFLDGILKFKVKFCDKCSLTRKIQKHKAYKWVHELIAHEAVKENNTNKHEIVNKIVSACIQLKYTNLLKFVMNFSKKTVKNPTFTIEALENRCFSYIFKCLKVSKKYPSIFLKDQVFLALIQCLDNVHSFENGILCLFSTRKFIKDFNNLHLKVLLDRFQHFVESDTSIRRLSYCENPAGITILIVELLRLFSQKKLLFRMKMLNLANRMLEFTVLYLKEINEISMLTMIICKPIAGKLNLKIVDILTEDPLFYEAILSADFMVNILKTHLSEGYQFDFNVWVASTSFHYMNSDFSLQHRPSNKVESAQTPTAKEEVASRRGSFTGYVTKVIDKNVFHYIQRAAQVDTNNNNHVYSYLIFTRNINVRLFIAFIFFSVLLGVIYYDIYTASKLSSRISNVSDDLIQYVTYLTLPPKYKDLVLQNLASLSDSAKKENVIYLKYIAKVPRFVNYVNDMSIGDFSPEVGCESILVTYTNTPEMKEYISECVQSGSAMIDFSKDVSTFIVIIFLILLLSAEIFVSKAYVKLRGYNCNHSRSRIIIYELSFILSVILVYDLFQIKNAAGQFNIETMIGDMKQLNILLNFELLLLMLIFFLYLSHIEKFGKMVQIVFLVMKQLAPYMLCLSFNIIYVALAFYVIFSQYIEEFKGLFECIKMAVEGFLGSFVFIESEEGSAIVFYFLAFTTYLLLCNAVFLNLIIAVLNNTYLKLNEAGKIFVSIQSYEMHKTHGYHKYYSGMISSPPPFNFFSMIFGFFLVNMKSRKANDIVLKIAYFSFAFPGFFALFLISHAILLPVAWLKIVGLIITNQYYTYDGFRYKVPRKTSVSHILQWIFGGWFYLIWNFFFNDLKEFLKSCFIEIDNRITVKPVSKMDWTVLKKIVKDYLHTETPFVSSKDFSEKLIEEYLDTKSEKVKETISALRRVTKSGPIPDDIKSVDDLGKKHEYEYSENSLEIFKKKYKAEKLFSRFIVNGTVDIEKMNILIQRLKHRNKKSRKLKGKIRKAYYLINLVNLKEFEEALRKWRGPEIEENRILDSLEYD